MPNNHPDQHSRIDQEEGPLWDLLGKVSPPKVNPAFAQNVVRATRHLPVKASLTDRFKDLLSLKAVAIGAVTACACILAVSQLTSEQNTNGITSNPEANQNSQTIAASPDTLEISEFILQETLLAAAKDPSIFTHEEVLAMVGF